MLPYSHNEEYFVKYRNIVREIQRMVLSMEIVSWKIFGDGSAGCKCMDTTVQDINKRVTHSVLTSLVLLSSWCTR
jgi:hypothetical protein